MSLLRQFPHRGLRSLPRICQCICPVPGSRYFSQDIVKENDIVLLKPISTKRNGTPLLSTPLQPGTKIHISKRDYISSDEIIGKEIRAGAVDSRYKRERFRIHRPTLGEFTDNSARVVTPIYSKDANLIVSLLDLNPTVPGTNDSTRLEIFEAGTGHGALTLHLAKAIHAANTAPPPFPQQKAIHDEPTSKELPEQVTNVEDAQGINDVLEVMKNEVQDAVESETGTSSEPMVKEVEAANEVDHSEKIAYDAWRSNRRAIIHTLDISATHSKHAQGVVRDFRQGMYFPAVDFHVGTIEEYLEKRLSETNQEPFLDHAILDLPDTHDHLELVAKALRPNGTLITFCPNITQINTCFLLTKKHGIPIFLEKVLELGSALGVGGREWDVRLAVIRADQKTEPKSIDIVETDSDEPETEHESAEPTIVSNPRTELVCRPKVGTKIIGGGFVGVWTKMHFSK